MIVVMNANTLAPTEYAIEGVLSVIEHGGEAHFVTATGLAKLADTGSIAAGAVDIRTGAIDLGIAGRKIVSTAVLTVASDGATTITSTADVGGQNRVIGTHQIPGRAHGAVVTQNVKMGRGVKLDTISLRISNSPCTAWRLSGLSCTANGLKR